MYTQCCRQMHTCPACVRRISDDEGCACTCCDGANHFRPPFCNGPTAPRHRDSRPVLGERQRGACVELGVVTAHSALSGVVTVTRPHSKLDGDAVGSGTRDRGAIANRKRAARRTRRLPVSSSSCAMSLRSAAGVSAAAGWVNLHSRVPRPRVRSRNDSRWQHVTFASSGAIQYPAAQDAQDQLFLPEGLLKQP